MRPLHQIIPPSQMVEGGGFPVKRPFPTHSLSFVDPFLLLDNFGPVTWEPGEAVGAPDHPHRGFETVTYMMQGSFIHEDSFGHKARIDPGDIQWMTTGSGLIHSETPAPEIIQKGGTVDGFQIWVNLPAKQKMTAPSYQEYRADAIARFEHQGATVRLIAGELAGHTGPVTPHWPVVMAHISVPAGHTLTFTLPETHNVLLYFHSGGGSIDDRLVKPGDTAWYKPGSGEIAFTSKEAIELLLLAGAPIGEPVARYGPFVMNSDAELDQAMADYRNGKMTPKAPE